MVEKICFYDLLNSRYYRERCVCHSLKITRKSFKKRLIFSLLVVLSPIQQKQYMPWVAQVTMPRPLRSWRRSNMRKRQNVLLVWFVHPYPNCGGLVGITSNNYSSRHWEIYIEKNATLGLRFQNIFKRYYYSVVAAIASSSKL